MVNVFRRVFEILNMINSLLIIVLVAVKLAKTS